MCSHAGQHIRTCVVPFSFEQLEMLWRHALPVYGRPLFYRVPSTFAPVDHVPVAAEYVIAAGGELYTSVAPSPGLQFAVGSVMPAA